jgi:hypothetical protein
MATYARIDVFVTNALGAALADNSVFFLTNQTTATVATVDLTQLTTIYTSSTGSTVAANPQRTDGYGHAACYLLQGNYTVAWVSPNGTVLQVFPDQAVFVGGTSTGAVINATTGFQFNSTAPSGHTLIGNGTYYVDGVLQFSQVGGSFSLNQTPLTTIGDLLTVNATPALDRLPGNTTTGYAFLLSRGTGSAANEPLWTDVNWSYLNGASAALTLANSGFATTFNQTSAVTWTWANTTAATSGTPQSSPIIALGGNYWTGGASSPAGWTIETVIGAGTNGTNLLTISSTGSTLGYTAVQVPNITVTGHLNNSNTDLAGTVTLTASTTATYTFATPFAFAPIVVVTPTSSPTATGIGDYWVTSTTMGFTVHCDTISSPPSSVTFNYHVIGNPN